jgi:hypothetical protein
VISLSRARPECERQACPGEQNIQPHPQPPRQVNDRSDSFQRAAEDGYLSLGKIKEIRAPDQEQDKNGAQQQRQDDVGPGTHRKATGTGHRAPRADAEPGPDREEQTSRWLGRQQITVEQHHEVEAHQRHHQDVRGGPHPAVTGRA